MISVAIVSINIDNYLSLAPHILRNYCLSDETIRDNFQIEIFDYQINISEREIKKDISSFDIICFSTYLWNIDLVIDILKKISPKYAILGGPEITNGYDIHRNKLPQNTIIILGEGAIPFRNILLDIKQNNKIRYKYCSDAEMSIDKITPVYSSTYFKNHLNKTAATDNKKFNLIFESMRGCPFNCAYCTWGRKKLRKYTISFVRKELKSIFNYRSIDLLYIVDSDICLDRERAVLIFKLLNRFSKNSPINFIYLELNPITITKKIAFNISRNSKVFASFGLQTTNKIVLKNISRNLNLDLYKRKALMYKSYGNILCFDIILGLPLDTYDGYLETLNYALSMKPEYLNIFILYILPGSRISIQSDKTGLKYMKYPPYKLIYSPSLRNLRKLEIISEWIRILLFFDKVRNILDSINEQNRINVYVKFISFLVRYRSFSKIKISLDYRYKTHIADYYNKDYENKLMLKVKQFIRKNSNE